MHHGTLLFDSRLDALKGALKVDLSKFEDKAVQSNRSEVTNIANHLPKPILVGDFTNFLFGEISQNYTEFQVYEPTAADITAIEKLSVEKYQTWDWIFGYSPRYRFTNKQETENGEIQISLLVEKGHIAEVGISGLIHPEFAHKIEKVLLGCRHDYEEVKTALEGMDRSLFTNKSMKELANEMF